ncbi:MAG: hypothetical protein MJ245_06735 [Clostridia bacterium]|nr:hypothetical protein [Clostridia bacterium]
MTRKTSFKFFTYALLIAISLSIFNSNFIEVQAVAMTGERHKNVTSSDKLFESNKSGVYNYCPTCISNGHTLDIWYCANENSYSVRDSIMYRNVTILDNESTYSEEKVVLRSTPNSWDSYHVCDPSVIEGNFSYNGQSYKYLMAYLGCSSTDNQDNKIGIAVSNSKDGNFIKCNNYPLVDYIHDYSHSEFQWGVGQPSLLSLGNGLVLLFYTSGTYNLTSEKVALYDLSNLNNPVLLNSVTVTNNGTGDFISNGDFSISGSEIYMVCDHHPYGGSVLSCIPDTSNIYSISLKDPNDANQILSDLQNGTWCYRSSLNGYRKNHNACFITYGNGVLASLNVIESIAEERSNFSDSLYTYRLRMIKAF